MNVDAILRTLNDEQVDYLLIGGMSYLLRHEPELTFDVDIFSDRHMLACQEALPEAERKSRRVAVLRAALRRQGES